MTTPPDHPHYFCSGHQLPVCATVVPAHSLCEMIQLIICKLPELLLPTGCRGVGAPSIH